MALQKKGGRGKSRACRAYCVGGALPTCDNFFCPFSAPYVALAQQRRKVLVLAFLFTARLADASFVGVFAPAPRPSAPPFRAYVIPKHSANVLPGACSRRRPLVIAFFGELEGDRTDRAVHQPWRSPPCAKAAQASSRTMPRLRVFRLFPALQALQRGAWLMASCVSCQVRRALRGLRRRLSLCSLRCCSCATRSSCFCSGVAQRFVLQLPRAAAAAFSTMQALAAIIVVLAPVPGPDATALCLRSAQITSPSPKSGFVRLEERLRRPRS